MRAALLDLQAELARPTSSVSATASPTDTATVPVEVAPTRVGRFEVRDMLGAGAKEVNGDFDLCPSCGLSRESIQTRPRSPTQITTAARLKEEEGDEPATQMERAVGQVLTGHGLRVVLVVLLVAPSVAAIALGLLGFLLWVLLG